METATKIDSVCTYCGVGCDIVGHVKENKIIKISASPDGYVSQGKLCIKGKYGFDFVHDQNRVRSPRIKKSFLKKNPEIHTAIGSALREFDADWFETDLESATTAAAMKLQEIQSVFVKKVSVPSVEHVLPVKAPICFKNSPDIRCIHRMWTTVRVSVTLRA